MVQSIGAHIVKTTCSLQTSVGLNVSECEYYALCHGAAHGLGLKAYLMDLGFDLNLTVLSDSSSALAFGSRRGLGKQRHVQTRYLWLQERVAHGHLHIGRVSTHHNMSDILTKACGRETLQRHMKRMGLIPVIPHARQKKLITDH